MEAEHLLSMQVQAAGCAMHFDAIHAKSYRASTHAVAENPLMMCRYMQPAVPCTVKPAIGAGSFRASRLAASELLFISAGTGSPLCHAL